MSFIPKISLLVNSSTSSNIVDVEDYNALPDVAENKGITFRTLNEVKGLFNIRTKYAKGLYRSDGEKWNFLGDDNTYIAGFEFVENTQYAPEQGDILVLNINKKWTTQKNTANDLNRSITVQKWYGQTDNSIGMYNATYLLETATAGKKIIITNPSPNCFVDLVDYQGLLSSVNYLEIAAGDVGIKMNGNTYQSVLWDVKLSNIRLIRTDTNWVLISF